MKLEVEIKDGKFRYSYWVGEGNQHHAERPISADGLIRFSRLLQDASNAWQSEYEELKDRVNALVWIEANPVEAKKAMEKKRDEKT